MNNPAAAEETIISSAYSHAVFDLKMPTGTVVSIDMIEIDGRLWFPVNEALDLLGFQRNAKGKHGRRVRRIDDIDLLPITSTAFRFSDGRRNKGLLVSPCGLQQAGTEGDTQGRNPIAARAFLEWLTKGTVDGTTILEVSSSKTITRRCHRTGLQFTPEWPLQFTSTGHSGGMSIEAVSPPRPAPCTADTVAPVFREVVQGVHEMDSGDRDPLRPVGTYRPQDKYNPLGDDEVEFCHCDSPHMPIRCWCGTRQGDVRAWKGDALVSIRREHPKAGKVYATRNTLTIDHDADDFHPIDRWRPIGA